MICMNFHLQLRWWVIAHAHQDWIISPENRAKKCKKILVKPPLSWLSWLFGDDCLDYLGWRPSYVGWWPSVSFFLFSPDKDLSASSWFMLSFPQWSWFMDCCFLLLWTKKWRLRGPDDFPGEKLWFSASQFLMFLEGLPFFWTHQNLSRTYDLWQR